jgi:ribosomal protein L40E
MAPAIHIFGFVLILIMGWVVFILWLIGQIFRGIFWGISGILRGGRRSMAPRSEFRRCTRLRCSAQNPAQANFCRRCGASLSPRVKSVRWAANSARSRFVVNEAR